MCVCVHVFVCACACVGVYSRGVATVWGSLFHGNVHMHGTLKILIELGHNYNQRNVIVRLQRSVSNIYGIPQLGEIPWNGTETLLQAWNTTNIFMR